MLGISPPGNITKLLQVKKQREQIRQSSELQVDNQNQEIPRIDNQDEFPSTSLPHLRDARSQRLEYKDSNNINTNSSNNNNNAMHSKISHHDKHHKLKDDRIRQNPAEETKVIIVSSADISFVCMCV